jgi:hypothetical protein
MGLACVTYKRLRVTYCATGVGHVVNKNGDLVADITNKNHATNDVRSGSLLVDESEAGVQAVSKRCSTLGSTGIGRNDNTVVDAEVLTDPTKDGGFSVKVVHGDVEEALDLRGVKIHCDNMILSYGQ